MVGYLLQISGVIIMVIYSLAVLFISNGIGVDLKHPEIMLIWDFLRGLTAFLFGLSLFCCGVLVSSLQKNLKERLRNTKGE